MKKTLMIALAGMMLFAFTQCGDGDSKKDGEEDIKGSKQYVAARKAYNEAEKILKDVKDCEEFHAAEKKLENIFGKVNYGFFEEKDKMTDKEEEEIRKIDKEFDKLFAKKLEYCKVDDDKKKVDDDKKKNDDDIDEDDEEDDEDDDF